MGRIFSNDLEEVINSFSSFTLYINVDSFQNITADFKSFNSIGECRLNDFLNRLLIKLIEHSTGRREFVCIYTDRFEELRKHGKDSGIKQTFKMNHLLKEELYNAEMRDSTLCNRYDDTMCAVAYMLFPEKRPDSKNYSKSYFANINDRAGYGSYIKKYFDALLNEYGSLSPDIRERLFFDEKYEQLSDCINRKCPVRIRSGGREFTVRPYRLIGDPAVKYLYLVGYVDDRIHTFKFARIIVLDSNMESMGKNLLSKAETAEIEKRIATSGIAYLSETVLKDIEVLMTARGFDLFSNVIIHQRPDLSAAKDITPVEKLSAAETEHFRELTGLFYTYRVHCSCTKRQAEQYFLRLGCNALVVSPAELSASCADFIQRSANAYSALGIKRGDGK